MSNFRATPGQAGRLDLARGLDGTLVIDGADLPATETDQTRYPRGCLLADQRCRRRPHPNFKVHAAALAAAHSEVIAAALNLALGKAKAPKGALGNDIVHVAIALV